MLSTPAAIADPPHALIRISCGGTTAANFTTDTPLLMSDGEVYAHPVAIDCSAANAAPESVYQHERYGPELVYAIPAPVPPAGKSYLVRLHFAELYDEGVGKRREDVTINGRTVLPKFDVFAEAGTRNKAVVRDFEGIQPKNGTIEISFRIVAGSTDANAAINGIEILADGFAPVFKPAARKHYPFQDTNRPTGQRVEDLLSHMTLAEKVGQMRFTAPGITRLGVPPYNWWNEALHGVGRAGIATVFPQAIGLAATWDTVLHQEDLLEALVGTGKPVVLVLLNGSALAVNWANDHVPGIVEAWYPGEEGGTAVADVLFGDYNPSGRLPVTFYRSVNDLPAFTDYSMKNRTYRYFTGKPLYPFGYGLSYSKFVYRALTLPQGVNPNADRKVRVQVQNVSDRAGSEVVQLYLRPSPSYTKHEIESGQPMPRLILAGFQRVELGAHQTKTVTLTLHPDQLRLVNMQGARILQPQDWNVYVGEGQPDLDAPDGHGASLMESLLLTFADVKPH